MHWTIRYKAQAEKQLSKLDRQIANRIVQFLGDRVLRSEQPYKTGKPLESELEGTCCYRVGDYRVLCDVYDEELVVEVVKVGHRREVYR